MQTSEVDIYLYAPGSILFEWQNVNFASGQFVTQIQPKWYNSSSTQSLQFKIVEAGTAPFMASLPAGPVFNSTYNPPSSGGVPAEADTSSPYTAIQNEQPAHTGLSGGKIAAAVIMPLLVVAAIAVAYWIWKKRVKGKQQRKRWSEAVDKRMSTISTDWKSVSAAGAKAAIRNSMAVSAAGNRNSSFSFGAIRPSSEMVADGGQAGIGARSAGGYEIDMSAPHMAQVRPGVKASAFGERVSRISFAPDTRPSSEFERRRTRAFHSSYVPPLPGTVEAGELSPTQAAGPLTLTAEDIRARMTGQEEPRPSMDVYPALSSKFRNSSRFSPYLIFV